MAPARSMNDSSQKITSFFKKFTIPKERRPDPSIIEDEIIVATPSSRASTAPDEPLYCICRKPEHGLMVGCDNEDCNKQWFHYRCAGLTEEPRGEWLCTECSTKPRSKLRIAPTDGRRSSQASPAKHALQLKSSQDTPRKRGRPRKESTSSLSSRHSSAGTPKRGRGRPPKSSLSSPSNTSRNSSLHADTATPRKSPLKYNVNPVTGLPDITPTKDSPYREPSATPSKQRVALGVELSPSPRSASPARAPVSSSSMAAPPVPAVSAPPRTAARAPVTSFSSISTLSSAPLSSGTTSAPISTASSSKRVISGGLKGVSNSDSESDGSDDDLADVSTFFVSKKPKLEPDVEAGPSHVAANTAKSSMQSERQRQQAVKKNFQSRISSPPRRTFHNLSSLARKNEEWQLAEAKIASLEQAVADLDRKEKEEEQNDVLENDVDGDALVAAAGSDDENRERMIIALERTEALHDPTRYHFFLDNRPQFPDTPFPVDALPNEPWTNLYRNDISRRQACITGFAAEMAAYRPLPVAVTSWLAQQLLHERDEVLCEAYVGILEVASHDHTSVSDTIASLSSMYKTRSFFENGSKEQVRKGLPPGLRYMMRVVQVCAPASDSIVPDAAPSMTTAAFLDLAMINIDEHVKQTAGLSGDVASCVEKMLDELTEGAFDMLITEAIGTLFLPDHLNSLTRCRIIAALPAGTERSYRLRRRLALECFSTVSDRKTAEYQDWLQSIITSLQSNPEFEMSERTDFNLLLVMIDVLDIAISSGFTSWSELHPPQAESSGPFSRPAKPTPAAKHHNSRIDAIVSELNYIASRIRDAGTTHLRRTEVKSATERLIVRLECSVRTRMKPKKSVFGGLVLQQAKLGRLTSRQPAKVEGKPIASVSSPVNHESESQASTPTADQAPTNITTTERKQHVKDEASMSAGAQTTGDVVDQEMSSDREDSEEFQTCVEFNTQSQ
ncbi:Inhibitor of growth protein 3 [Pseudocercospora fuligena]|uniref:Inhibitor of growth protein 3 n=1 Tax=Pseudocercospora fuligena TaxID=685502 RepID=A0A8H6VCM8_9PEZI|nr:Inhibitor of growth protein 3 [Pseudocercospora fuligena]